jgi:hypothetical protein
MPTRRWCPHPLLVAYRRADIGSATDPRAAGAEAGPGRAGSPRYWTWAALMRRAFDLDVLRCPRCAGRMQLIATIEDPAVIQRIRAHLGLPGTREGLATPVFQEGDRDQTGTQKCHGRGRRFIPLWTGGFTLALRFG